MKDVLEMPAKYPDFSFLPSKLSKFIRAGGLFTIMLLDSSIIHFEPKDCNSFLEWLQYFNIKDLRANEF
jgi:hypothetical protein